MKWIFNNFFSFKRAFMQYVHKIGKISIMKGVCYKQFMVPLLFIGVGLLGVIFKDIHLYVDMNIRNWILSIGVSQTSVADYLPHVPVIAVYILGFCGIRGKHNLRDKTIILLLSYTISILIVQSLKSLFGIMRPDGSSFNAFPSGHTATAFMSAEFFRLEYKDKFKFISRLGYVTASITGLLRIYTNRHWLTDVIAGTGFGILSTRLSYLIFLQVQRNRSRNNTSLKEKHGRKERS